MTEVTRVGGVPVAEHDSPVRAPGTLASHYAPRATVRVVDDLAGFPDVPETSGAPVTSRILEISGVPETSGPPRTGLLALAAVPTPPGVVRLSAPEDPAGYARALYRALREADALGLTQVIAVPPPPEGIGAAVRDRLVRAAATARR
ncbi:MAG: Sua5 family C-terminal domain-containing protein [Kineosporiaceae bacterium]